MQLYIVDLDRYSELNIGKEVSIKDNGYVTITQIIKIDCIHGIVYFLGVEV